MHKLNLQLKLLSPLVHTEETSSNIANIFREKVVIDGKIQEVPSFHGNSLRGTLRDLGFDKMLSMIGYKEKEMKLGIFHTLFSGGALSGNPVGLDIEEKGKIRKLLPLLSILGSAMGNEMLEGKLIVSNFRPQCKELNTGSLSHWDMVQIVRYTRKDDSKGEGGKRINDKEGEQKQQMFYDTETLVAGVILEGEILIDTEDEVEIGAFYSALEALKDKPYIGGASRVGHGKIEILNEIDFSYAKAYDKYVLSHKNEIIEWIQEQ